MRRLQVTVDLLSEESSPSVIGYLDQDDSPDDGDDDRNPDLRGHLKRHPSQLCIFRHGDLDGVLGGHELNVEDFRYGGKVGSEINDTKKYFAMNVNDDDDQMGMESSS